MTQADEVCAGNDRPEFASDDYRDDKDTLLVFNRAMQWLRPPGGNIIWYCTGGDLPLTGEQQVSRWVSDRANLIEHAGDWIIFQKRSAGRHDWLALPAFQFNLLQHPRLELTVAEASDDWQLCVLVKDRSGPPLVFSPWERQLTTLTLDLVEGEHEVKLAAEGAVSRQASLQVRVTDGQFHRYDPDLKLITRGGKVRGPLTGRYHGTFMVSNAGRPDEELMMGQAACEARSRAHPLRLSSHQWWGITEAELDENFSYLAECGWSLLHLAVNWATWERLDVGDPWTALCPTNLQLLQIFAGRN